MSSHNKLTVCVFRLIYTHLDLKSYQLRKHVKDNKRKQKGFELLIEDFFKYQKDKTDLNSLWRRVDRQSCFVFCHASYVIRVGLGYIGSPVPKDCIINTCIDAIKHPLSSLAQDHKKVVTKRSPSPCQDGIYGLNSHAFVCP